MRDLPCVLVPAAHAVAEDGEDAGRVQSVGARFAQNQMTLEQASDACAALARLPAEAANSGHGGHFAGVAEASA